MIEVNNGWRKTFERLENLVMAETGADEATEIYRMILCAAYLFSKRSSNADALKSKDTLEATDLRALLRTASTEWKGVFEGDESFSISDENLEVCFNQIILPMVRKDDLEIMDNAFEYLTNKNKKGEKGQYFTPRFVVQAIVDIMVPKLGEQVADPACGSAAFLVESFRKYNVPERQLWGFDYDAHAVKTARILTLLASANGMHLAYANSLLKKQNQLYLLDSQAGNGFLTIEDYVRASKGPEHGFDLIMTNPPFAGGIIDSSLIGTYSLGLGRSQVERDVLFLERCVDLLRAGGRLAIILPNNKLSAPSYEYVRKWLLRQARIVAVIGLPRSTFLPHTHQKTSVVIAVKRQQVQSARKAEKILFCISEIEPKDSRGNLIPSEMFETQNTRYGQVRTDIGQIVDEARDFLVSALSEEA